MPKEIRVDVFHGVEASVNAYILSDSQSIILIDCLRNSKEAQELADQIKKQDKPLTHLLITHGHPDHYLGMNILKQSFPDLQIVVASKEIKKDISDFSSWMQGVGWLETEPAMKPLTPENSGGFDYLNQISVIDGNTLQLAGGAVLTIESDYLSAEAEHLTTVFSEDLNALFTSDFCYHGVHPWLAISREHIVNWKNQLDELTRKWETANPTLYPGHGKPGDISLFEEVGNYILDFETTVATSRSREDAMNRMISLYPDFEQADFLLLYSVNAFVKA